MEKLSKEKLVTMVISKLYYEPYKIELIRRLSRLEELEHENGVMGSLIDSMRVELRDLDCCGNCKKHHNDKNGLRMDRCNSRIYEKYCPSHEPDGLSRKERMK